MNKKFYLPLIILLGLALRLIQLDVQPLWWDEGYSVFFATRDLPTMLARTAIDIHPPFYYAILQAWLAVFGPGSAALRLLSVVIGVAAIPLLYLVARELFNRPVALAAAFLLAISPLQIYYSQEVRMYGLVTLLALASVALQLRILVTHSPAYRGVSPHSLLLWVGYILVTALALYTEYLAAFLIAAQVVVILYLKFRTRWQLDLRAWLLAWLGIAILYLPWVVYAAPKLYTYVTSKVGIEQYSRLDPATYLVQHLTAFSTGHVTDWTWLGWGAILFVALALLGFFAGRRWHAGEENSQLVVYNSLAAIYLLIPLALGFLLNLVYTFHPIRYERLLLFAAPFFLIYVACGIVALFERERALGTIATAVIAVLCAISLFDFYTIPRYADEDYRPLIAEMEKIAARNDLVYAIYPWQLGYLASYYHGAPINLYEVDSDRWVNNPQQLSSDLANLRAQNPRAWILAYQKQGRILEDRLTNEYINDYVIDDQTFGNTRLQYFAQGSTTDFELAPLTLSPELVLRIQYAAFEPPASPDLALARFAWNAANDQYAYSLRVVDAANNKIAQQDDAIPTGATTLRRALALPHTLPAGEYQLQLVVYNRSTLEPVPLPNNAAAITLNTFTIAP